MKETWQPSTGRLVSCSSDSYSSESNDGLLGTADGPHCRRRRRNTFGKGLAPGRTEAFGLQSFAIEAVGSFSSPVAVIRQFTPSSDEDCKTGIPLTSSRGVTLGRVSSCSSTSTTVDPHEPKSILYRQVYEPEFKQDTIKESKFHGPRGLRIGGGTPTQGTRHRIRARACARLADTESGDPLDHELLNDGLADGILVSEQEVREIRKKAWRPRGSGVPLTHKLKLGYHTAWDIGKKGCIALKLRFSWESSLNPNRLRLFIMDGTDPQCFLSFYKTTDISVFSTKRQNREIILASDLQQAFWSYDRGRIKVQRSDKNGRVMIIDRIPSHFLDAMIVCLREMEVCRTVNRLKALRLLERKKRNERRTISPAPRRSTVDTCATPEASSVVAGTPPGSTIKEPTTPMKRFRQRKNQSVAIIAQRKNARAVVPPNSSVVASVVASRQQAKQQLPTLVPPSA